LKRSKTTKEELTGLDSEAIDTSSPYGNHLGSNGEIKKFTIEAQINHDTFEKGTLVNIVVCDKSIYSAFFPKE
jgi:hypothetical protein